MKEQDHEDGGHYFISMGDGTAVTMETCSRVDCSYPDLSDDIDVST